MYLTFNVKHNDFAFDRVGVDSAPILSLILPLNVSYLEVPLFNIRPHDTEPEVIDHSPVFIRQRYRFDVQPGNLIIYVMISIFLTFKQLAN